MHKKKHVRSRPPHPAINIQHYLRGNEQGRMIVTGPKQVIDRFNWICRELNYTKWEILELLMLSAEFNKTQLDPAMKDNSFQDANFFKGQAS